MSPLETAARLARQICTAARWRNGSCGWPGETGQPLDADLYAGNAGVAWFLGQHAALTGAEQSARTAVGAARHVLNIVAERPAPRSGLFQGDLGALWATSRVGTLIGEAELVDGAHALVPVVQNRLRHDHAGFDLVGGSAGDLLAMLGLAESTVRDADRVGQLLARRADQMPFGMAWPARSERTPDSPAWTPSARSADGPAIHHVGMAHGPSGVACALLELDRVTGATRYRTAALDAFAFERAWFDPAACAWRNPQTRTASTSWCHGSAGIGLARLRALELLPEPRFQAEAGAALASVHASVAGALSSTLTANSWEQANFSICHGLMGAADLLLQAAEVLGVEEHRRAAVRIVDHGIEIANSNGRWVCGTADGSESIGLFLGLAGIGTVCLRVAFPGRLPPVGLPVYLYSTS